MLHISDHYRCYDNEILAFGHLILSTSALGIYVFFQNITWQICFLNSHIEFFQLLKEPNICWEQRQMIYEDFSLLHSWFISISCATLLKRIVSYPTLKLVSNMPFLGGRTGFEMSTLLISKNQEEYSNIDWNQEAPILLEDISSQGATGRLKTDLNKTFEKWCLIFRGTFDYLNKPKMNIWKYHWKD